MHNAFEEGLMCVAIDFFGEIAEIKVTARTISIFFVTKVDDLPISLASSTLLIISGKKRKSP